MSVSDLPARLREVCDDVGGPSAMAKKAGVPLRTLNEHLTGTKISTERLVAYADAGDVRLDWLAAGIGEKKRGGSAKISTGAEIRARGHKSEEAGVPVPPVLSEPGAAFEAASLPLDASALISIATWWFEFLDAREAARKPRWSAQMRALGLAQIYLGATASGRVDESSIKEVLRMFD